MGNGDAGSRFFYSKLVGGMRLRGSSSVPGKAKDLQGSDYCNVRNFDHPVVEKRKILDIRF
jgi:hypothetical protein